MAKSQKVQKPIAGTQRVMKRDKDGNSFSVNGKRLGRPARYNAEQEALITKAVQDNGGVKGAMVFLQAQAAKSPNGKYGLFIKISMPTIRGVIDPLVKSGKITLTRGRKAGTVVTSSKTKTTKTKVKATKGKKTATKATKGKAVKRSKPAAKPVVTPEVPAETTSTPEAA